MKPYTVCEILSNFGIDFLGIINKFYVYGIALNPAYNTEQLIQQTLSFNCIMICDSHRHHNIN